MNEFLSSTLPGLAEMMNIHPLLVHFPIALLNGFIIMEILGFIFKKESMRNAASWMLYLGTLGALSAVLAGFAAAATVPHDEEVHAIMTRHKHFGVSVLLIALTLSVWRLIVKEQFSKYLQLAHLAAGIIMVGAMTLGADLGGLMVYKYGVAVKAAPHPASHDHSMGGHDQGSRDEMDDMDDLKGMTLEDMEKEEKENHDHHDHSSHKH